MKTKFVAAAALVALLWTPASAQTFPSLKISVGEGEQSAITFFVEDSVGDVLLGRLGLQRANDPAVRALAQAMVRDHTRSALAGMDVARQIADEQAHLKAGDDNQIELSHLARYSGAKFDREYAAVLVDAHKSDIQTAHDALEFATTPAVRAYLRTTIATDTRHLRMAEAAQARVGSD
jgi:putative membrane protein